MADKTAKKAAPETRLGVHEGDQVPLHLCNRVAAAAGAGAKFEFIPTRGAERNILDAEREVRKLISDATHEAEKIREVAQGVLADAQAEAAKILEAAKREAASILKGAAAKAKKAPAKPTEKK